MIRGMEEVKITRNVLRLLSVMVNNHEHDFYGLELAEMLKMSYGSLLPVLTRLEKAEWLETDWENIDPTKVGRPQRKYYRLSESGLPKAKATVKSEVSFLQGKVKLV